MRFNFLDMPQPLFQLLTIFLTTATVSANPLGQSLQGLSFNQLFGRSNCANPCGWAGQLCCGTGQVCYTDASNQAQCSSPALSVAPTSAAAAGGYWSMYTTTYVETDLKTITTVVSSYMGAAAATPTSWLPAATTAAPTCDYSNNESPCGSICCASGQYCVVSGQCAAADNGASSGAVVYTTYMTTMDGSTVAFSAPLRPTSSTLVVSTATVSPTTTVAFLAPVATGANVTLTATEAQASSGLSGGAIAGIVIGVLLGLALLFLICFYCCIKGLLDGLLAIFGLGKRRRRTTETEYVEEYHRHSDGRGGGRTWYGAGSRPGRVEKRTEKKKSGGMGNLLGVGAGLAGLAAVLGIKRRSEKKNSEKYSDYTSSYGSYYTSASSESSDRRTRDTRRSISRSRR